jgi:hypothetical protein
MNPLSWTTQYASSIQGRYLNFGARFMKNVLFEQKKVEL